MDCKAIFISANDSSTLVPVIRSMLNGLMSDRGEVSNPCCTIYIWLSRTQRFDGDFPSTYRNS